jgi:hypothetical protein
MTSLSFAIWEFALLCGLHHSASQQNRSGLPILTTVLNQWSILTLPLKVSLIEQYVLYCMLLHRTSLPQFPAARAMGELQRCWHVCSSRVEVTLKTHFRRLHEAIATVILRLLHKGKPFSCLLTDLQEGKSLVLLTEFAA